MASQIQLGSTSFPVGTRQFLIDSLPGNSEGLELILGIGASWRATTSNALFNIVVEISLDGVTYQHWITATAKGGNVLTPIGTQLNEFRILGLWPGEHDGSANPLGRRKLRGVSLRATVTVFEAFTAESVMLRTI